MTLDDFFTLTEMNNGLAAPSRVRELVAIMEKERNSMLKNAADSTRQWSAVASTIVATENKDCLDLFLQLDGLGFISKWLKDAQKLDDDTSGSFAEESITHLLRALEKLDVDHEKLLASGILETVQNLLMHNNSMVQSKAQALFESWNLKTKTDSTTSIPDVDKSGASTVDEPGKSDDIERVVGHSESPMKGPSICQENPVSTKGHELLIDNPVLSTSPDALDPEKVESSDKSLNLPTGDEGSLDHVNSASLQTSLVEPTPGRPDNTTCEPCVAAAPRQDAVDSQRELNDSESSMYTKQPVKAESFSDKVGLLETSKGRSLTSSSLVDEEMKTAAGSPQKNLTAENNSFDEDVSRIDSMEIDSNVNGVKQEGDGSNQYKPSRAFIVKTGGNSNHHMLPRSSNSEKNWGNPKDLATFLSGTENRGKVNTPDLHVSEKDRANNYTFSRNLMDRGPDRAGKKSDVEIDYGIVDPLEYAMQVAMEVEREAVDDRERSCGSSGKSPEGHTRQPRSPDSVSQKQSHSSEGSHKEVVNEPNISDESSPTQEESATSSGHQDVDQTNGTQDMATSQVTEVAQEEANEERGHCKFDLNEEVCSEDPDRSENQLFAPVSIVSASRAAAAPGQPGAPLQFEGNLGWKGSAITSAFRPASPRRMKESDKEPSTGGSSSSSKQRQGFLDFDLNVADSVDLKAGDWTADKHVQLYSTVASGESSAETSSRRSEHLALDLNHSSEDGAPLLDWRIGQFFPQRQHQMSSKQPTRNIDLNDQPNFLNDSSVTTYLSPVSQNFNIPGSIKSDDSVISIMGKRVEVNRKDFASQTPQLANGRAPELPFDVNMGRTGNLLGIGSATSYSNTPGYGYNNFSPGPPMHFPSTIYGSGGPIPYMVDSRGQPVFPQIVGSASALPPAFSQPPFLVNLNASTPSNGVGPSRSSFDLNSGMLLESGSSKDPAGFGLFLNSAQVRSVEEQSRPNSQPTMNSVFSGKRKEPENGWDHYPFRHCTPPWKQS